MDSCGSLSGDIRVNTTLQWFTDIRHAFTYSKWLLLRSYFTSPCRLSNNTEPGKYSRKYDQSRPPTKDTQIKYISLTCYMTTYLTAVVHTITNKSTNRHKLGKPVWFYFIIIIHTTIFHFPLWIYFEEMVLCDNLLRSRMCFPELFFPMPKPGGRAIRGSNNQGKIKTNHVT